MKARCIHRPQPAHSKMLTVKWTEANCLLQTSPNLTNIASLNFHRNTKRPRGFFVPAGSDLPFSSRSCSNNSAEEPGSIFSTYSPRVSRLWLGEGKKKSRKSKVVLQSVHTQKHSEPLGRIPAMPSPSHTNSTTSSAPQPRHLSEQNRSQAVI